MLEFRQAAAANKPMEMQRLSINLGANFNIDGTGVSSGKSAAHFAAERGHFNAIYWLFENGADFYFPDNAGHTAIDYLQQKEFTSINSEPMVQGDRKYHVCNSHFKIWLAHDPEIFMPYLYQEDFKQYRDKNPDGSISLVYSETLLSQTSLLDLMAFAEKYRISLISFESDLEKLTNRFGTETDKQSYRLASEELQHYLSKSGGNLAVVTDLIRWSTVLLRIGGNYSDTDVKIGKFKWSGPILTEKSLTFNLGSLIHSDKAVEPWINGDIIVVSSLFSKLHSKGHYKVTLSKTACSIIQKVQSCLILSCQKNMTNRRKNQQFLMKTLSNLSFFLKDYAKNCSSDRCFTDNFSADEIRGIQEGGLESFSKLERASIIERMANIMRKNKEKEYDTPEMAHKHSIVFRNVKIDEHEKFLTNCMQALQMSNIKEGVKSLTGAYVFVRILLARIEMDNWEKYSIYSNETLRSAFLSSNTVKLNTDKQENKRTIMTKKCADLSFTPLGMADVLKRSQEMKEKHEK